MKPRKGHSCFVFSFLSSLFTILADWLADQYHTHTHTHIHAPLVLFDYIHAEIPVRCHAVNLAFPGQSVELRKTIYMTFVSFLSIYCL